MTPRLAAGIQASALIRRVEAIGGSAAVLARGDATAGTILIACCDRGEFRLLLERRPGVDGQYAWARSGPEQIGAQAGIEEYLARRRRTDPDLWVIEVDIAGVERFAAEMMTTG